MTNEDQTPEADYDNRTMVERPCRGCGQVPLFGFQKSRIKRNDWLCPMCVKAHRRDWISSGGPVWVRIRKAEKEAAERGETLPSSYAAEQLKLYNENRLRRNKGDV